MVLAEPAAGAGFAKLADFGVAHLASGDPLTRTGDVVGTLAYMAPEQAEGERVSPACDVYSLALTLYEAWTGSNPVRAASPAATARRLGRPLPPLAKKRRDLPPRAVRDDRPGAPPGSGRAPDARAAARDAAAGRGLAVGRGRPGGARDAGALRPDGRAPPALAARCRWPCSPAWERGSPPAGSSWPRSSSSGPSLPSRRYGGGGGRAGGGAAPPRRLDRERGRAVRLARVARGGPRGNGARAGGRACARAPPVAARGAAVVRPGARAPARNGGLGTCVRGSRSALDRCMAPCRPRRRRLPLARAGRGALRRGPAVRGARRHARARVLGGTRSAARRPTRFSRS